MSYFFLHVKLLLVVISHNLRKIHLTFGSCNLAFMNFVGTFFRKGNTNTFTAKASLKVPDLLFLCTAVLPNYLVLAPLHSLSIYWHPPRQDGMQINRERKE